MKNKMRNNIYILAGFLLLFNFNSSSQNLKKIFAKIEKGKNNDYIEVLKTFYTKEKINTVAARFACASVLDKDNLIWQENWYIYQKITGGEHYSLDYGNNKKWIFKLVAFEHINKTSELWTTIQDNEKSKIIKYITKDKIDNLQKKLEDYFLSLDKEIFLSIHGKLSKINSSNQFKIKQNNRFVDLKFEFLKQKPNSKYEISDLLKEFPDYHKKSEVNYYLDSLAVSEAKSISDIVYINERITNRKLIERLRKKVVEICKKHQIENIYKQLFIISEASDENDAINKVIKNSKGKTVLFYQLTDKEIAKFNTKNRYLIYLEPAKFIKEKLSQKIQEIVPDKNFEYLNEKVRKLYKYPEAYIFNTLTGLQFKSKQEVYFRGNSLSKLRNTIIIYIEKNDYNTDAQIDASKKIINFLIKKFPEEYNIYASDFSIAQMYEIYNEPNPFPILRFVPEDYYNEELENEMKAIFVMEGKNPKVINISYWAEEMVLNSIYYECKDYFKSD